MLLHPTLEKLTTMRFTGMAAALDEQMKMDGLEDMGFEERLGLLLDREQDVRETRRMNTRLRKAKLRQDGCIEDIDFRHPRGLDKSLVIRLADCQWIKKHNNLFITGSTGVGKSYLACAFAQKACREGFSALYLRTTKLFEDMSLAKGDGRYLKLLPRFCNQMTIKHEKGNILKWLPAKENNLRSHLFHESKEYQTMCPSTIQKSYHQ